MLAPHSTVKMTERFKAEIAEKNAEIERLRAHIVELSAVLAAAIFLRAVAGKPDFVGALTVLFDMVAAVEDKR